MARANRDRPARADHATAGMLDVASQAPVAGGGTAGRRAAGPAGHGARSVARPAPATGPPWRRWACGRPVLRHAALLCGFVAAGLAVTWPRITYLGGQLPASRDSASYVWGFWWVARQVTHLGNPWFTHNMAAPAGVPLGFHTLMPLPGLLMTPVTLAFGPATSYNLVVAIVPGLLCYAAFRAARLWLRSVTGAIAAGAFFGLSAMLTQQDWYHLNIAAGAVFLPMALEASVRLRRTPCRRQAVILGLVMGAAVLTDQESAVLAAIVTGLTLLPWLLRRPSAAKVRPAALAVIVGTVIASPQIVAMLQEVAVGGLAIPAPLLALSYEKYGIGLPGMFAPTPRVAHFGLGALAEPFLHGRDNEGMPMFGTVLTGLALLGVIAARRRRGTWLLAGLWAGCAALALGLTLWIGRHEYLPLASWWHGVQVSDIMPYTWFVRIPGLSSFREADRLAILGLLPAALLAGAAVDWLRYHAKPLIVLVAALGVLEAGYAGSANVGIIPARYPEVDAGIAADPSNSIVVDLPFGLRGGIPVHGLPFFPQALVMATNDAHPRAIAYTSRVPQRTISKISEHPFYRNLITVQHEVPRTCPWSLNGCPSPPGVAPRAPIKVTGAQLAAARRDATGLGIGWVVVWKRNISVQSFLLPYLRRTGFSYAYRVGNILIYRHGR